MWFIALLCLLNAVLHNELFVNTYRLHIAGLPANIFDGMLFLGCIFALLRPRNSAGFIKTERMHPAMMWILILFAAASLGGLVAASTSEANLRQVLTTLRNFLAAPMALYMAYFLTGNFKSSRRFLYASVLAGLAVSFMIVVFFREATSSGLLTRDVFQIRAVAYNASYAGLAACLLFYSMTSGVRLMPTLMALGLMGVCVVGQATTLSRSDWIACATGIGAAFIVLPRGLRWPSLTRSLIALPFLVISIYGGIFAASQFTGRDMFNKMHGRVMSMLPGDRPGAPKLKAWDSRLPGTMQELRMWASNPIVGGGFGIHDTSAMQPHHVSGLRHNTWTSTLAETGIIGFAAFAMLVGGMMVAGWRMTRDRLDQTSILVGALGVMGGAYFIIHGLATMSFNQMRYGLPLFVLCGVVLRTRAMQLEAKRQLAQDQAELEAYGYEQQDAFETEPQQRPVDEPVFGNWYQPN